MSPKATQKIEHTGLEPGSHETRSVFLGKQLEYLKHLGKGETQEGALLGRLALSSCYRPSVEALSLRVAAGPYCSKGSKQFSG